MKKFVTFALALFMLFCLAACGTKTEELTGQVADLLHDGYEVGLTVQNDTIIGVMLEKDTSHIAVSTPATEKMIEEYQSIEIFDDDYDEKIDAFVCSFNPVTIEELDSLIPSEEELAAYVGKTISDVEDQNYYQSGYIWNENEHILSYDNDKIVLDFTIDDTAGIIYIDSASAEQVSALVIAKAEFNDISTNYFDN